MPVFMMSTAYALFSQQLSIDATGASVSYVSNQYMTMTYTKIASLAGSTWTYSMNPVTIKNNGVTSVTAWQTTFTVPADAPTPTCSAAVVCTRSGTTVTVKNGAGNGTIASGGTVTFTMSFTTTTAAYTLQNVTISGTFATTFQTITGLTVTITAGTSTKKGATWTWKPTITVTNNSGQALSGWQVVVTPWSTAYAVTSTMPAGISFTASATQLTFTSTNALASGASYQFIPTITTNTASWSPTATVQGKA